MSELVRDIIWLPGRRVTGREIAAEIAARYGLTMADMLGRDLRKAIVHPRQHAMWEVRRRAPHLSLPQIGKLFGGRDHATVIHALRQHEARLTVQREAA